MVTNVQVFAQETEPATTSSETATAQENNNETIVPSKVYQGEVQIDTSIDDTFTGEQKNVDKGTKLELTVSTVISSDSSTEGDEFFSEVSSDLTVDGGIVIPIGTVIHGKVTESKTQKRLGRNGYVNIDFDYIVTPDGREIPISAKLTTKSSPLKSFAKVALIDTGYTLAGGVLGGIMALKLGGLGMAIASHGYTIAGGAALGAAAGATSSLIRKGKPLMISPGDQIKVKMTADLNLPVIKQSALKDEEKNLEGLDVNITACKYEKDPFGSYNTITVGLDIRNQTEQTFSFFDVAMVDEQGSVYYPSPFGDTEMWFQKLSPGTKLQGKLSFSVDNPHHRHWLIFYDKYNRTQLAKISIRNAMRKFEAANNKAHM